MELGTLLVKLSANTTGFSSKMSEGAKSLEDFAKGAKKISGDLGQVGVAVTAFGGAMTALAATVDGRAEKSLTNLKNASALLGVQIYDIVAPAIHDMTEGLKRAADMVAALSPEVKASASRFAEWAVGIGVAGMALQKIFTLGEALFSVFKTGFAMLSAPVLAFIAALAGIGAVVLVIVDNWDTFKDTFSGVVDYAKKIWHDMMFVMSAAWEGFVDVLATGLEGMGLDSMAAKLRAALSPDALGASIKSLGQSVASAVSDGLSTAFKSAERGAKKVGDALGLNDAIAKLKALADGSKGAARQPEKRWWEGASDAPKSVMQMMVEQQSTNARPALSTRMGGFDMRDVDVSQKDIAPKSDVAGTVIAAVTNKLGELGGVINSIVQGAQSGGVWGAIVAAIMEIISRMKGFTELLDGAMQMIYDIAEALEPILTPIFEFLKDVFADIGKIFKDLAPLWKLLGQLVSALLTPLKWLIDGITAIIDEISGAAQDKRNAAYLRKYNAASDEEKKQMKDESARGGVSGDLLDKLAATIAAADATVNFANILKQATDATQAEAKEFMDRWKAAYGSASVVELAKKFGLSEEETKFATAQYNAMAAAAGEGAGKLSDLNEQLSDAMQNVPKGVKIALARFNATDGLSVGNAGGGAPYSIGPVYINAASGKALWDELTSIAAGDANLKMGNSVAIMRAHKGFP